MYKGLFISVEGIDGTGKTTQINRLENCLKSEGHDVICTFEPGASSIGKEVRAFILDSRYDIAPLTETLLLCADRYEHQQNIIIPALQAGKTVLADRTQDSTVAYQAFGKGVDLKLIEDFDRQYLIRPDITFYLDIESEKTAGRIDRRLQSAGEQNKFDIYATDFFDRVRRGYRYLCERFPERIRVIHADRTPDAVFADITAELNRFRQRHNR